MPPGLKTFIIDGYNLLRRHPAFARWEHQEGLERACDHLEGLLRAKLQAKQERFILVWDSPRRHEKRSHGGRLTVIFSGPGKADAVIIELARQWGTRATVVSDDNEVRRQSSAVGAQIISTTDFADHLLPGGKQGSSTDVGEKPTEPLTPEEVEYWKKLFSQGKAQPE